MPDSAKVSIIVLNWNGLADTVECLESLRAVTHPDLEVIVVDNASQGEDVAELRRRFGDYVRVIESATNRGFAGGCNLGIQDALERGADYVLLLNNDTVVDPGFLERLVAAAEELADAAAVCPKICYYRSPRVIQSTGGLVNPWTGTARQLGRDEPDDGRYDAIEERDYADGACLLIRRSALEAVGPLDEEYFAYWEETDWCDRARTAGFKCYYVPTARIWHKEGAASPDGRRRFLFRRNAFLFLRRRKRPWHLATAVLFHLFVLAPLYVARRPLAPGRLLVEAKALLWHLIHPGRHRRRSSAPQNVRLSGPTEGPTP